MIMGAKSNIYKLDFTQSTGDVTVSEIDAMIRDIDVKLSKIRNNTNRVETYKALSTIKNSLLQARQILECEQTISELKNEGL